MLLLDQTAQDKAAAFFEDHARPLERRLYAYHFQAGSRESVLEELAKFQNPDGGFGHALEPDFRLPESSALATTHALQILREMGAAPSHPLVQKSIRYLVSTYNADHMVWPMIPPHTSQAPHAPWWTYRDDLSLWINNPRPEVVGYFFEYESLVPGDLCARLLEAVVNHLESLPESTEMHDDLLCYVRLAETKTLPENARVRIVNKIEQIAARSITTDPAAWSGYAFRPLKLVGHPGALCAAQFAAAVQLNLDYEIEHQGDDGAWHPYWTWGDLFPEAWPVAAQEWRGVLTLNTLKALRAFARLG
ncbi:MAG: hypothetical protein HY866_09910 [Chloroflexi bacterium]|nr:hypothetical protein [Chloroflexota bacterium]